MVGSLARLAVSLQAVTELVQQFADHRMADLMAHVAQALAELAKALARPLQRRLRIAAGIGLDQRAQILHQAISVVLSGLRPPPGRRTRPSDISFRRSSASPRPMVLRARPVARITALTPPRPAAIASAAPKRRRPLSSNFGESVSYRSRIADSSITPI